MKFQAVQLLFSAGLSFALSSTAAAQEPTTAPTAAALKAEIDALQAPKVAWRGIGWKTCLLDGLKESKAKKKPLLLWVFIDRPCDDARC